MLYRSRPHKCLTCVQIELKFSVRGNSSQTQLTEHAIRDTMSPAMLHRPYGERRARDMSKQHDERERAKQIIVEIVRSAGGCLHNKTNLFKAFYHAHLQFARENAGVLTAWPIVRMPKGPGIHRANSLLLELVAEGLLVVSRVESGNHYAYRFAIADTLRNKSQAISDSERRAVEYGVESVAGKTAAVVSHDSHVQSHSWNDATDGQELPIYADLLTAEEYAAAKADAALAAQYFRRRRASSDQSQLVPPTQK